MKRFVLNKVELETFIIECCREYSFENIKFATDIRGYPSGLSVAVYLTEKDFEKGRQYINIRFEMIGCNQSSNIKDNMENYQIYR